ncbi:MAG: Na(+)/H(+) antiporter subunit D, partial [Methanothrix sp.]
MVIGWLHPGLILILGAFLIPLFKGKWRQGYLLIPPIAALIDVILMYTGVFGDIPFSTWRLPFLEYELVFGRVDRLSFIFGLIFTIAALIGTLYALHVKSSSEHMSQYIYVGSALGVVFAGDLITLYIFWEIMAIASTLIIWHGATDKAHRAGFRYIMWHIAGGIILL